MLRARKREAFCSVQWGASQAEERDRFSKEKAFESLLRLVGWRVDRVQNTGVGNWAPGRRNAQAHSLSEDTQ